MANHALPTLTSTYTNVFTQLDDRFDDQAKMFDPATVTTTVTGVPTNTIRWNSTTNNWTKFNGSTWATLSSLYAISVSGTSSNVTGTVAVANGGTGGTTQAAARTGLGLGTLATLNTVNDGNWSGTDLAVANGGTGASDAATARTNLGLGTLATLSAINDSNWSGSALAIANGGTGGGTAAAARTNLGLVIGTDVPSPTGTGASGSWGINAATVTDGLYLTGTQTVTGNKTFTGSLSHSSATEAQVLAVKTGTGASASYIFNNAGAWGVYDSVGGYLITKSKIDNVIAIGGVPVEGVVKNALNATGSAPVYACRAWVNFNGTGTVAIRASGNVSSITDNGAGNYTVNMVTGLPDANYSVVAAGGNSGTFGFECIAANSAQAQVISRNTNNGTAQDVATVMVAIFR